jgi:antitoxin component HigA of HigAB toxin-antitoxin module
MEQFSRKHVVDLLTRLGHTQVAEEAAQALPDPVGIHQLAAWMTQRGLTYDDLISQMGGSP